jgi:hypothetical protein
MKGYYTQVIKLEEGTVNLDNIVLVKVERWEFGVLGGIYYPRGSDKHFYDFIDSNRDWGYENKDYANWWKLLRYKDSRIEFNVGAYVFFSPGKRNKRIKTLIGLGLTYYSKKINTSGYAHNKVNYDYYASKEYGDFVGWSWDFSLKQVVNTLDVSFLIKHKIRIRKCGICLVYGPSYGVPVANSLNIKGGELEEQYKGEYEEDDEWVTYNDISESKCGITYEKAEKEFKTDFDNKFVLGGLGALGFEYPSGVGVWCTYTMRCYQTKAGCWNMRVPSLGATLTYKF